MYRTTFSIAALAVLLGFAATNASAQIRSTARPFLQKADSISLLFARDAALVLLFSWDVDTTGKAISWMFKYVSRNSATVYAIAGQNGQVTFHDSSDYIGVFYNVPASWIDSDSALSVAQRAIGSATLAQFPSCPIFAELIAGGDALNPSVEWRITYGPSEGRWRAAIINAVTGGIIGTYVTDVQRFENESLPTGLKLYHNYPNPFNPSTTIVFFLPHQSFVSLKIYDLRGKEVASLASEVLSAGIYSREWNASNMASGIYFCRLQSESSIQANKLLLLK